MEPAQAAKPAETVRPIRCACGTPRLMTVAAASATTGVSDEAWHERLRAGLLPGKRLGRRWLVPTDFVHGFVDAPNGTRLEDYAAQWLAREAQAVAS